MSEQKDDMFSRTRMLDDEDPRDSQTHILKTLFPGKTKEEYVLVMLKIF